MDGILQSTANDMNKQKECVDIALNRRIHETRDSKEKLEDHLSKVNKYFISKTNNFQNFFSIFWTETCLQVDHHFRSSLEIWLDGYVYKTFA